MRDGYWVTQLELIRENASVPASFRAASSFQRKVLTLSLSAAAVCLTKPNPGCVCAE